MLLSWPGPCMVSKARLVMFLMFPLVANDASLPNGAYAGSSDVEILSPVGSPSYISPSPSSAHPSCQLSGSMPCRRCTWSPSSFSWHISFRVPSACHCPQSTFLLLFLVGGMAMPAISPLLPLLQAGFILDQLSSWKQGEPMVETPRWP